jgi:1-acyl-sn-glycerol-3-phosphate acyltransferase
MGWKLKGDFDPNIKKTVAVVAPHTSWHDFYILALARKLVCVDVNYVAKKELFDGPFGWYFKWMGGEAIDRSSKNNKVQQIVNIFNSKEEFRMAIAPEGTRKKVSEWKTGFYRIAEQAKVPLTFVILDYKTKTVNIPEVFYISGDYERDIIEIKAFYKDAVGKVPEYT